MHPPDQYRQKKLAQSPRSTYGLCSHGKTTMLACKHHKCPRPAQGMPHPWQLIRSTQRLLSECGCPEQAAQTGAESQKHEGVSFSWENTHQSPATPISALGHPKSHPAHNN